ncbi:MAG: glycosyltransferase family 39 protein [Chloroflexota bacterium]
MITKSSFSRYWLPAAIFAFACLIRTYELTAPLLDYHSWRQADTAAIARNFMLNGYQWMYPQVDWGGTTPGFVESEFPLYSFSLALLYGVFGEFDWLGRVITLFASGMAAVALYMLIRKCTDVLYPALYAALVLALMPFAIYFGRTVMPDSLMLLTAILALWSFAHWLQQPTIARFGIALLCGALAPLAKTPNLAILIVPLAYLVWNVRTQRRLWPFLLMYGCVFIVPSLLWMRHAQTLPLDPRLSFGIGEKLFELRLLIDPQFYILLFRWSIENLITLIGIPFFLLGITPIAKQFQQSATTQTDKEEHQLSVRLLPHAWLLGCVLFVFAGAAGVVEQDYYILPLAGPLAWFMGIGLYRGQRLFENRIGHISKGFIQPKLGKLIPIVGLTVFAAMSFVRIAPFYQTADFYQTLGQRVNLALPEGERVGVIAPAVSEILYYGQRKGWRLDPGVIVPGGLASLQPDLGVRYVVIVDPWLTEQRDVLTQALGEYRRIPIGPYALLLDITQPGLSGAAEMVWETGYLVEEPFLSAWQDSGGQDWLGYPISDALETEDGVVQYFEFGVLKQAESGVERLPVGQLLLEADNLQQQNAQVDSAFTKVWADAGGERFFGPVLSPTIATAQGHTIQYFVYGILEAGPNDQLRIRDVGRELLHKRGLSVERQIELLDK